MRRGGRNLTSVDESFSLYGRGGENRGLNRWQERWRRPSLIESQHRSCYTLWIKSNAFRRCLQCLKPYKLLLMKILSVLIYSLTISIQKHFFSTAEAESRCFRVIIFLLHDLFSPSMSWGPRHFIASYEPSMRHLKTFCHFGPREGHLTNWKFNIYFPMHVRLPSGLFRGCCSGVARMNARRDVSWCWNVELNYSFFKQVSFQYPFDNISQYFVQIDRFIYVTRFTWTERKWRLHESSDLP